MLDGYNVLTTVEAALGGGVILAGRDGCYRDMASMHGTYRKVAETIPALTHIGQTLAELDVASVRWYFDSPVSNSGRLKAVVLQLAGQRDWPWEVQLVRDPDRVLVGARQTIVTADSGVLDRCGPWLNLARRVVERWVGDAWLVDFRK